ncbi:hypothetical protein [Brachybacterium sp. GPGPB12]|uniref:hypothetical protein n=1 Tax=Brachybacterium sp. GPGPB12 TaxID=3023517 RepID=UPI003134414D
MKGIPWYASLRFRFAAVLAVTSFSIAAPLGAWIAHVALGDAREQMREQAAATLRAGTATYETTRTVAPTVQFGDEGLPAGLARRAHEHDDVVTFADDSATWAAVEAQDGFTLSVRLPNAPVVDRWEELARTILLLSLAVAAAASAIGWFVSGGLTRRRVAPRRSPSNAATCRAATPRSPGSAPRPVADRRKSIPAPRRRASGTRSPCSPGSSRRLRTSYC